uniref:Uncharacterized protein n=1 Tax=Bombyx mori TaxID=7091 RepID=A0A8R2M9D7_BOMMO|nr:uncharacterized protein LOC119630561 [Bombyx mori]
MTKLPLSHPWWRCRRHQKRDQDSTLTGVTCLNMFEVQRKNMMQIRIPVTVSEITGRKFIGNRQMPIHVFGALRLICTSMNVYWMVHSSLSRISQQASKQESKQVSVGKKN